jgi:hypothetical protein
MATLGLAVVTVVLALVAVRSSRLGSKLTLAAFWTAYTVAAFVFSGVIAV